MINRLSGDENNRSVLETGPVLLTGYSYPEPVVSCLHIYSYYLFHILITPALFALNQYLYLYL